MFARLISLLRGTKAWGRKDAARRERSASQSEARFRQLNTVAPLLSEVVKARAQGVASGDVPASPPAQAILCREAVLGKDKRVAGYIVSLSYRINPRLHAASVSMQRLHDQVLVRNVQELAIQRLLAHRLAFVELSASSLDDPFLEAPQPQGIVYVVGGTPQLATSPDAGLANLRRLRSRGFRIGLRADAAHPGAVLPFLEQADFLFVDIANSEIPAIRDQIDAALRRAPEIRLVAANIQTLEEYSVCAGLPFACYHGPFITSREKLDTLKMDAGRIRILQLLNRLRGDAETSELTALIRQNLTLSYKLLRYINSPGIGLVHKVGTLEQALMVLGRQKFYRWLTLMLFISGEQGLSGAVMENALIRARLAELCARDALSADECDELFVAGMFSLLDVVLAMPMADVLKQVSLPAAVAEVLLQREGKYAPYLDLAVACEQSDGGNVAELAQALGLEVSRVNGFHQEAMLWAQQVGE